VGVLGVLLLDWLPLFDFFFDFLDFDECIVTIGCGIGLGTITDSFQWTWPSPVKVIISPAIEE